MFNAVPPFVRETEHPDFNEGSCSVDLSANRGSFFRVMNSSDSLHTEKAVRLCFYRSLISCRRSFERPKIKNSSTLVVDFAGHGR